MQEHVSPAAAEPATEAADAVAPATPYQRIGGEAGLRRFTQRMYALMDSLPEAAAVRALHPEELSGSEQKLFEFLSGWLACFHQSMQENVDDAELREFLWSRIEPLALHMRNQQALPLRWSP